MEIVAVMVRTRILKRDAPATVEDPLQKAKRRVLVRGEAKTWALVSYEEGAGEKKEKEELLEEAAEKDAAGAEQAPSSSDDGSEDEHLNSRERTLKRRSSRRAVAMERYNMERVGQATFLEASSVSRSTRETYEKAVREFCLWCRLRGEELKEDAKVDGEMVKFMNAMYQEGHRSWKGERVFAGLLCLAPQFGRFGEAHLPRTMRALKGWRRLTPSFSRKPLVWACWAALATELYRMGEPLLGVLVLISVEAYLRPSEALSLRPENFLAPTKQAVDHWVIILFPQAGMKRSKVGEADDTVALDSGRMEWMSEVYRVLSNREAGRKIWDLKYSSFAQAFRRAALNLDLEAVPYQMRHSGASIDRALSTRSLDSIAKRGRWMAQKSVRRYEKMGRLNETWQELKPKQRTYMEFCEKSLAKTFLTGVLPSPFVKA